MTSGDLYRILQASEAAGLQRFLFHNHAHLTAAEWAVISRMCGTAWDEDPDGRLLASGNAYRAQVSKVPL